MISLVRKNLRRLSALLLVLVLMFSIPGCSFSGKQDKNEITQQSVTVDNPEFNTFADNLFKETIHSDTLSLHAYLENPEDFGIDNYEVSLGRYDLNELDKTKDISECMSQMNSFERDSLSPRQQLTYDQLKLYLENELEFCDLSLLDSNLSKTTGIQVQLPLILAEYTLKDEKDVTEYLALVSDVDGYFQNIVDYEKLRAAKGYFMEDSIADGIVEQCQTFVNSAETGVLITTFNERLDLLSSITPEKKEEYKISNQNAVREHVVKGYNILIQGLQGMKGTNKYNGGLCNYPDGKKFYEYLIKKDLGWSKSIDEYNALLDSYIKKNMLTMQMLMSKDNSLIDKFSSFGFSLTDPIGILDDLKSRIQTDFPDGPEISCEVKKVSESLQDYASPAMYFTPQIDNLTQNSIYINPGSTDNSRLYTTLAHEGYPGHMYQMTYFAETNPTLIRYLIEPGGYVEGWATYCELFSYRYADTDDDNLNALSRANMATILCLYAKVDLGINYYGWKVDDIFKFISDYGYNDKKIAEEMYSSMVSNPGNYCKYVLGCIGFEEMKKIAQNKLGDKFCNKDFHKFILDLGPVQFDIMNERMDEWLKDEAAS